MRGTFLFQIVTGTNGVSDEVHFLLWQRFCMTSLRDFSRFREGRGTKLATVIGGRRRFAPFS